MRIFNNWIEYPFILQLVGKISSFLEKWTTSIFLLIILKKFLKKFVSGKEKALTDDIFTPKS